MEFESIKNLPCYNELKRIIFNRTCRNIAGGHFQTVNGKVVLVAILLENMPKTVSLGIFQIVQDVLAKNKIHAAIIINGQKKF